MRTRNTVVPGKSKAHWEKWVRDNGDDDEYSDENLVAAFRAVFGRKPDAVDREQGLWSHLCQACSVTTEAGEAEATRKETEGKQ